jgi:hypothetical protein
MGKPGAGLTIIAICLPFLGKTVRVTLRRPGEVSPQTQIVLACRAEAQRRRERKKTSNIEH